MRPPNNADALSMRVQILDAAAGLLRHRSYEAATVRAIAGAAGIKAGSLYHHFPSKDAIVVAVLNEGVRVVHQAVETALAALPPDVSPREHLRVAVQAHLQSSLRNSDYTSAAVRTFGLLPDALRQECRAARRRYEAIWANIVSDAARAGLLAPSLSQDVVRLTLLGAINWAGEWYRPGRIGIDRIARDMADLVFGTA